MRLGDVAIDPPVPLAPMAGLTERPFRALAARWNAGLRVTEMLAGIAEMGALDAEAPLARAG